MCATSRNLKQQREKAVFDKIFSSNILSEIRWILKITDEKTGEFGLLAKNQIFNKKTSEYELENILRPILDHQCFGISPNVLLRIDDGNIDLSFDSPQIRLNFIKRWNLQIEVDDIIEQFENLKKATKTLEQIVNLFNK